MQVSLKESHIFGVPAGAKESRRVPRVPLESERKLLRRYKGAMKAPGEPKKGSRQTKRA